MAIIALMKTATVSQLKNELSRYLAYVRKGGRVRVLDRATLVAELAPPAWAGSPAAERIRELERLGIARCGPNFGKPLPAWWWKRPRPKKHALGSRIIIQEREARR